MTARTTLSFLVETLNYQARIIDEYRKGKRDKRFTSAQNAERLQGLVGQWDALYQHEFCPLARACGYEYLPLPAVPHWQRASNDSGLWLDYAPPPQYEFSQ
jgi:hypothetical protein